MSATPRKEPLVITLGTPGTRSGWILQPSTRIVSAIQDQKDRGNRQFANDPISPYCKPSLSDRGFEGLGGVVPFRDSGSYSVGNTNPPEAPAQLETNHRKRIFKTHTRIVPSGK